MNVLSRKILLAFLAFTIILVIAALFVRDKITERLAHTAQVSHLMDLNNSRPQQALLLLHEAEDLFQSSLVDASTAKAQAYQDKLSMAFAEIDTLLNMQHDTTRLNTAQRAQLRTWHTQKVKLSAELFSARRDFDSLLTTYSDLNTATTQNRLAVKSSRTVQNSSDTLTQPGTVKRKGFFARIKEAIKNKNAYATGTGNVVINHQTRVYIDSVTQKLRTKDKYAYLNKLKQLEQSNLKLQETQRQLIMLNMRITHKMEQLIAAIKDINYSMTDAFKGLAFNSYLETTSLLNKLYLITLLLLLAFAILLIVFVIKLGKSEELLLKENERAVMIARQKMDLLLHMSHEIRNPLTSINGFLYIFSRTTLTPKQAEMLGTVRASSDLLLQTLNDTLDAAKMESSELKIHQDPFCPDKTLKEVIESMAFSADKKQLGLNYHFEGDPDAEVLGDSFRLKQIMVNLISNAIKYTDTGSIKIIATLKFADSKGELTIDITDTGAGISQEQQVNLFSKYYQTNSAKGNTGTGLGLYICKQLLELQKGKISVKSDAGKGSTFSFEIPYEKYGID
ncbi:HAMP domain-containing histidine kinase [Mucilaginibacter rubeus]|uniref:histidine kinase n=1 Tax=Mucilaginibacter rubeus TaxID=2027860 RepID=A0AAE6JEA0_9SPHI|nr:MULTISPECIES: HAMP domain-containing sensor histidine kinase [Mucilaginibacter]QEM04032.1 HAMP domain-containing histidine kinase [Mucilaginibacter rubeus]QEM16635.1 HAMP domain-containing histidine kinase [Mucilaginibacter gossypii]QTE46892.1 HAMP domain-containing histidine kinase [Mucilaginibacter rubeus]QTE53490.1 HAMP domain-containing histidine kinase [Mucilaginibacter rubeus]QTE58576.1 HAMP domain-containing histidine kinase [Mucilaginibacter rubeus]